MQKARRHRLLRSDRLQAYGFRYYFTPLSRVLFTFPLRYWFTIGRQGVFSLTGWYRQIQTGFLWSRPTQDTARPAQFLLTGLSPAMATLSRVFNLMCNSKCSPTTPVQHATPVWALPRSLATTWGIICYFLFLRVLRCFSSPGWLSFEWYVFNVSGCPIRKSSDITLVCSSPKLIAAYHVLHRLLSPRHPPYALNCFKYFSINIKVYNVNLYFKLYYLRRFVTAIDRKNHIAVIFIFSDNYDGTINHTNITKSF